MSETLQLWSATSLIKQALGTSYRLVEHNKRTIAEIMFDRQKMLRAYVEENDREGAVEWALGKYWDNLNTAAARGTDIHRTAEALALGTAIEVADEIQPYVDQYRRFLEDFQPEFLLAEAPVYNLTAGYAGTLDGIVRMEGKKLVLDYKTTAHGPNAVNAKGRPKARPPFPEVALQLTLYRRAELVGLLAERVETQRGRYYTFNPEAHTEPMPETDGGVCIVISPEDYLVVPVDTSERIWKACRHMIEVARFQVETSKTVFGPPATPGRTKDAPNVPARILGVDLDPDPAAR